MKKILSIILVLAIVMALPVGAAAAKPQATAVTISGSAGYTAKTRTESEAVVKGLEGMVLNAVKASPPKSGGTFEISEIATLMFEYAGGNTASYSVYKSDQGGLYIVKSDKPYQLSGSASQFYALADESGRSFYKLRGIPKADGLSIIESSYAFKKLDGNYYKTQFVPTSGAIPVKSTSKLIKPTFSQTPESVQVRAIVDGKPEWSGTLDNLADFTPKSSGIYQIQYIADFGSQYTTGKVTYAYEFKNITGIQFLMDGARTYPGEVVVLRARNVPEGQTFSVTTNLGYKPEFFKEKDSGDYVALMPVSYNTAAGTYTVNFKCGNATESRGIAVQDKAFQTQHLTVPPATAQETIYNQQADDEYEKHIAPIRKISDNKQYWNGQFAWPLKTQLRVTTQFGMIRYTNGSKTPSRHGAIDFAAAAGTPVYASGAGRVLYAGFLQLTGNTVVIEHGYGLKTWHYHMNKLDVKTGDAVKQGAKIGEVGSTGFSTGAHLHFGMSVSNSTNGNVFVNPETAISKNLFADLAKSATDQPHG